MKRDRGFATIEEPYKRRKEEEPGSSSDVEMGAPAEEEEFVAVDEEEREEEEEENTQTVTEKGMKMWQIVKDADKDGRPLAINFLKRPNSRIWADYYVIIKNPIALEDIKKKLKHGEYPDLESVRQDFELCFNNAKTYNLPESVIYGDAKELMKLTNKTFRKLTHEHGKPPSMKRLLNSRIQKLVKKTDDYGRILSSEFMELPPKKVWPGYYQQIQQPRCISVIQKQVKRKEYESASDFAADMELVFSNAMQFNVEHTQIWEDALTLRDYFRQIMADLPPPYNLPQYAQPINKIRIKMRGAAPAPAPPKVEEPMTLPNLSLRVPAPAKREPPLPEVKASSPKPPAPATPAPAPAAVVVPAPAIQPPKVIAKPSAVPPIPKPTVVHPAPKQPIAQPVPKQPTFAAPKQSTPRTPQPSTPQPILQLHPTTAPSYSNLSFVKPSQLSYMQPTFPTAVPTPSYIPAPVPASTPTPISAIAQRPPPPPVLPPSHQLRCVTLTSEPRGRVLRLDHRDHVTNWAMRLERDEKTLSVKEITFMADPGESSGEEDDGEDDDNDMDTDAAPVLKKRGRGRPPKATKANASSISKAQAISPKKKKTKKRGQTQVKLNGTVVAEDEERRGNWTVEISAGRNLIEVGEKGGLIWKVYAERVG